MTMDTIKINNEINILYQSMAMLTDILKSNDKTKNMDYYDNELSQLDLSADFPELIIANAYQDEIWSSNCYEYLDRVMKIIYSFATLVESKNNQGLVDDTLKYLRYAKFFDGLAYLITNTIHLENVKKRRIEISQMGGNAKSAHRKPLKDYVAKLLVSHKPVSGWDSKAEAVKYILKDVSAFNEKSGRLYTEDAHDGMKTLITRWLTDDLKLKSIVENNLSPKARERYERRNRLK